MVGMSRPVQTITGFRTLGLLLALASGCTGAIGTTSDHPQDSGPGDLSGPGDSNPAGDPATPGDPPRPGDSAGPSDSIGPAFENLTPPAWPANIYVDVAATITVPTYTLTPDTIYYDYYKNAETTPYRVGNTAPVHTPRSSEGIVAGNSLHIVARAVYSGVEYPGVSSEPKIVQATPSSVLTATTQVASIQWTSGTPTSPVTPVTASGGTPPYAFGVSPALPTPLQLDATTGQIASATVGGTSPSTLYTVTVTDNATPQASAQATFTAAVGTISTVGNPELFTHTALEMDFTRGANGQYRANDGAWQDFDSWDQGCDWGGGYCRWQNGVLWVESPGYGSNAGKTRTELVTNAVGSGRVLHAWIEQGDLMHNTALYPRTEFYSDPTTSEIPFNSEWRLEIPLYMDGNLQTGGFDSIVGWQMRRNGDVSSPPLEFDMNNALLKMYAFDSNVFRTYNIFAVQPNTRFDVVIETKFGHQSDGAYFKMWVNGTTYVDITDMDIGFPDVDTVAGWWKFCGIYDWKNTVIGTRSVYCGPDVKFLRKP